MATTLYYMMYAFTCFYPDALFGLESANSRIIEDENEIMVCVETKKPDNTDCPVAFEFSLHLSITSDTAGTN